LAKQEATRVRSQVSVFRLGEEEAHVRRLRILSDLRVAVEENQLELYVQPKVHVETGDLSGAEALVRWEHPELGMILPNEFIMLAEEAGSISEVTFWVLAEALRVCAVWKQQGIHIPISVNLSTQDLNNENLPDKIAFMLQSAGLAADSLVVEITEAALAHNLDRAKDVLRDLQEIGITTSMDDFGTGYSSLHQLKQLPLNELKIDRAFVANLPDDAADVAIVQATINIANTLGLAVVAEGVESEEAWSFLLRQGCNYVQGYLVSRPIKATDFTEWAGRYALAHSNPALEWPTKQQGVN
jgi:EAL domain-containing protein (putative c-di-GMP-specific phosphodiesterase class I)